MGTGQLRQTTNSVRRSASHCGTTSDQLATGIAIPQTSNDHWLRIPLLITKESPTAYCGKTVDDVAGMTIGWADLGVLLTGEDARAVTRSRAVPQ
jgi:hypothetical protein